ncbi:MAG: ABC transporter permease [Alphaproteobacteria bacterium]|nr:ABC transporter permease [Alphaproteobacteria bacterium]
MTGMLRDWRLMRNGFLLAVTLFVYLFLLGPVVVIAVASLESSMAYHFTLTPENPSLRWYFAIPGKYLHAFGVSFLVASISALIATALGAMAALGIVRGQSRGAQLLQTFFRLPLQIPLVVTGVVFLQFYYLLFDLLGVSLLGKLAGVVTAHVFITIPYNVSTVAVVLMRTGTRLDEAAESLGATPWSAFRRVTLPAMKPGLFVGLFYSFIISFGDVPVTVFLAGSGFVTLPVEIFHTLQFDWEPAVLALSTLVVLFSFALIVVVQRVVGLDLVVPQSRR